MQICYGGLAPVYAGDLAMPVKAKPVNVVPPLAPSWTGWNFGISLGARIAKITGTSESFGGLPPPLVVKSFALATHTAFIGISQKF